MDVFSLGATFFVVAVVGLMFAALMTPARRKAGMTPKELAIVARGGLLCVLIIVGQLGKLSGNSIVYPIAVGVQLIGTIVLISMMWIDWSRSKSKSTGDI